MTIAIQARQPVNIKALSWSVGGHLLLLLLFFLWRYYVPAPIVTVDSGMEVNLGTNETGSGDDQPMSHEDPSAYSASVVYKNSATPKVAAPDNMIRTNDANAPVVSETNKKTGNTENDNTVAHKDAKPKYLYPGYNGKGGNSANDDKKGTNEGNNKGNGDQGVPGGTPNAKNYTGTPGAGTGGIGHNLTGRKISPDKFEAEFNESGKVVIHVTVDRNGTIVNRLVKSTSSAQLTKIALEKLDNVRFSKSTSSDPQQFGDVTIVFKTR